MEKVQGGIRRIPIPNLQSQWKISFSIYRGLASDIRLQTLPNQPYDSPVGSLTLTFGPLPEWRLTYQQDAVLIAHPVPYGYGDELAKVELTHERDAEEGRYTLALSVGGEVVGRVDADIHTFELNPFKMFVRGKTDIKRVVILDKPHPF